MMRPGCVTLALRSYFGKNAPTPSKRREFFPFASLAILAVLQSRYVLQVAIYGQCGYLPASSRSIATTTAALTRTVYTGGTGTSTSSALDSSVYSGICTKFKFFGINKSDAEFGSKVQTYFHIANWD
ncbi:hypothetical protein BYT27DRAFT_7211967 [Phlegmacium glaucopus]|nr:hypothetical protein BYT27DRAFT_7211967 [Phlegmacium glaucopus]